MNKRYYYSCSALALQEIEDENILGYLAANNDFELTLEARNSWRDQIPILRDNLSNLTEGQLYFEYTIPRMGKRCDVILLYKDTVFVIEFKVGAQKYLKSDERQTVDYALDLKNFHKQSHSLKIVPILIATEASDIRNTIAFEKDNITNCQFSSGQNLMGIIESFEYDDCKIKYEKWSNSSYQPTPTIVEAARALYRDHSVESISRNDASAKNLTDTCSCVESIIANSKKNHRKSICFITGVPGAGKTLAGLNIATSIMEAENKEYSTFLSGNGPLVTVLQRALAVDKKTREGVSLEQAKRETKAFIQNIHHFRDDYITDLKAPSDQVVIFDEAQRAWTKEKASKFMKNKKSVDDFDKSEPQFLIEVMDRHQDWCVIIALIGGGQEINDGEAGLPEWFKAINSSPSNWDTYYSPQINKTEYLLSSNLEQILPSNAISKSDLHLSVSLRSFRAENVSNFINAIIANKPEDASHLADDVLKTYPAYVTRCLEKAKQWIRKEKRGNERYGITASSNAKRLAPHGIQMKIQIDPEHWFLSHSEDIRSSNFMELSASQFDIQGLELDWAIVGWDADLRRENGDWKHYSFSGSNWRNINKEIDQLYLRNAYRVILSRARQGMVIFLPKGDEIDTTRKPSFYEPIYEYLKSCGLKDLPTL